MRVAQLAHVRVAHAHVGCEHGFAISRTGELYAFGTHHRGQLGVGMLEASLLEEVQRQLSSPRRGPSCPSKFKTARSPTRVEALRGTAVAHALADGCNDSDFSVILTRSGDVFTCGDLYAECQRRRPPPELGAPYGVPLQLGHGLVDYVEAEAQSWAEWLPRRVLGLPAIAEIATSDDGVTIARARTAELFGWGSNDRHQLGFAHGDAPGAHFESRPRRLFEAKERV